MKRLQDAGAFLFWQNEEDVLADIRNGSKIEGQNCNNERQDDEDVGDKFGFIHNRFASLARPLLEISRGLQVE